MTLEERFWSRVWRCNHSYPCHRCCWPWIGVMTPERYNDERECYVRGGRQARFTHPDLPRVFPAHLFAYILVEAGGTLTFPGRFIEACHRCDYGHCCNPAHITLGSQSDNARDKTGKTYAIRRAYYVIFPDGRKVFPKRH